MSHGLFQSSSNPRYLKSINSPPFRGNEDLDHSYTHVIHISCNIYLTVVPIFIGKWVKSAESRYADQPVEIRAPKNAATGFEQDLAFVLSEPHKHYGIATK